ncbi:MAG: hypothetical protein JRI57_04125 [Deltaproteobacteria bacterium]|nr:hypothetical protein [Deltaproteobacteria bacterium]MBW1951659.1 hypothetical protein [Deltaproteobacteria bacterium]MBW1985759.1 hypothetical protein [Deltaproteobacteria bacterium]MBW2134672.1 hypothetical protein [Deltaproteobacteria bacterium]
MIRAVQLNTDCEGPLCLNDNAFELCRDFMPPHGDKFFTQVSRYDDYLADVVKKPDYKAGDTLKLILPFLKAYGLTNQQILDYSLRTMVLVPGAEAAYRFLHGLGLPIFEISTSYRQFALAVGLKLGFDEAHIFATPLDLDRYSLSTQEAKYLQQLAVEIAALPEIRVPDPALAPADLEGPTQEAIARLDQIFGELIREMEIGTIYQEVNPVGGSEKERALVASLAQTGLPMAAAIYVGDSITDVQAFQAVRAGGGLAVSFNGNRYAVNHAEIIVIADTVWPVALITTLFRQRGQAAVLGMARQGLPADLTALGLPPEWRAAISGGLQGREAALYVAGMDPPEQIISQSAAMRARLRGAAIAALS